MKKVYEIPEGSRTSKGRAIVNFVGIDPARRRPPIARRSRRWCPVSEFKDGLDLVTATAKGLVKRTELTAYANIRQTGIIGVAIEDGDALLRGGGHRRARHEIMLGTRRGHVHPLPGRRTSARWAATRAACTASTCATTTRWSPWTSSDDAADAAGARGLRERLRQAHARRGVPPARAAAASASSPSTRASATATVVDLDLVTEDDEIMVITDRGQIIRTRVSEVRQCGPQHPGRAHHPAGRATRRWWPSSPSPSPSPTDVATESFPPPPPDGDAEADLQN